MQVRVLHETHRNILTLSWSVLEYLKNVSPFAHGVGLAAFSRPLVGNASRGLFPLGQVASFGVVLSQHYLDRCNEGMYEPRHQLPEASTGAALIKSKNTELLARSGEADTNGRSSRQS